MYIYYRAPKVKITINDTGCTFCVKGQCLDDRRPSEVQRRTTRSMSRLKNETEDIIIYENYRCMPLLGNEKMTASGWEEHVASYAVVFCKNSES